MVAGDGGPTTRRRGRRPAGEDTRDALLAAAREVFTEHGYEAATVRTIAARAGVDAAMVNHWFGGKQGLFGQAVLNLPFRPMDLVQRLLDGDPDTLPERLVRTFLGVWDPHGGGLVALIRSVTTQEEVSHALRDLFVEQVFKKVTEALALDRPRLRATLCASQLIGLGMVRYVLKFEPLASADPDTITAAVAPVLRRYLSADL